MDKLLINNKEWTTPVKEAVGNFNTQDKYNYEKKEITLPSIVLFTSFTPFLAFSVF